MKTKTKKIFIKTKDGIFQYQLNGRLMEQVEEDRRGVLRIMDTGYYMTVAEMRRVIRAVYNPNAQSVDPKARVGFGNCAEDFAVMQNRFGGINIGCNVFTLATTRKLARWCGYNVKKVVKNAPTWIVEKQVSGKWIPSQNSSLSGKAFSTEEEANDAIREYGARDINYRTRDIRAGI